MRISSRSEEPSMKNRVNKTKMSSYSRILAAADCLLGDFDALDRGKTLFILPVGSLEAHGWHLPNGTDMITTQIMAEETARIFAGAHHDWTVVILPLLNIGTDELPLPGSIEFSRKTVYRALCEYGRSLSRWGFRNLVVTNGHGGLRHNLALDDACRTCNRKYGMRMVSPGVRVFEYFIFGKKFPLIEAELGRKLRATEMEGLTDLEHAGGWETSIIQHIRGDLVAPDFAKYRSSRIRMGNIALSIARIIDKFIRFIPILGRLLSRVGIPVE
jgi:creatinine amidohydrolase